MINSSPAEYAFIRACIVFLQSIAPISIAYTICHVLLVLTGQQRHLPLAPLLVRVWFASETAFYLAFQLPWLAFIQRPAEHPPLLSCAERQTLFARVTKDNSAADIERHVRGWFRGAPLADIGREGVKSWLAWAFFEGRIGDEQEKAGDELEQYTTQLETILGKRLPEGHGTARPIRLTLDSIDLTYRSLTWYGCVGFVDFLTYLRLLRDGYHHHRQPLTRFFTLFPFRPVALTARRTSPVKHLTYWHRPHTSHTRLPVLFIHGIGIGLYPYVPFLDDLIKHVDDDHATQADGDDGQIGILAVEIMPVSFRLTHAALSRAAMCDEINTILSNHGWDECVLVAHSYGTVIATHMLHNAVLRPKISSVLLIDPVCFLLHNPDVAYNFTARQPTHANEWQLWYFASQDPGVAHTLGRRFFWSENVLWLEDLRLMMESGLKVAVSLAGRDLIVHTEAVGKYLVGGSPHEVEKLWREKEWTDGNGLEVLWNEDRDHAQVFDGRDGGLLRKRLVKVVRRYCNRNRPSPKSNGVIGEKL